MSTPQIAQGLAGLGRNGDSVLVHMQPQEVMGLQAIAHANGTSLTTNPDTGMPEAFSLGGFFRQLLPVAAGFGVNLIPGAGQLASPLVMGALAGATVGAATSEDPLMGAITGGLGGASGGGLGEAFAKTGLETAVQNTALPEIAAQQTGPAFAQQLQNVNTAALEGMGSSQFISPFTQTGEFGVSTAGSMVSPAAPYAGSQGAMVTNAIPANPAANYLKPTTTEIGGANLYSAPQQTFGQNLETAGRGIGDLFQKGGFDRFKNAIGAESDLGAAMKIGMPLGGAVLGGLEPEDLYGPGVAPERKKYRGLNLDYDTGLRLAEGGKVPGSRLNLREEQQEQQAQIQPVQQPQPQPQTELGLAALKPNQENEVKIEIAQPQVAPQETPILGLAQQEGIPAAMQQLGGQGVDFEKLYGRTQGAMAPQPMQPIRGYGPDGRRMAAGGAIQQGGLMDLYGASDSQATAPVSSSGYGLGRLSSLVNENALNRAQQGSYAAGGGLEDGGFVIPADVVSGLGNGSTDAGLAVLAKKYGAKAIKGPGDGMSDDIHTTINGKEKARVADGEAYIPRAIVKKMGGPEKLYAMMDRVRKARTGTTKQGKEINPHKLT